jgi:glyoxylase I family protein
MSLKEIRNFDYTILLCDNMKETRAFYKDVLCFPLGHDLERWVGFRVGSSLLALRPRGLNPPWDDGPAMPGTAAVQLAFRVPPIAVDTCHAELVANGVPIVREPAELLPTQDEGEKWIT